MSYRSTGLRVLGQWYWIEDPEEKYCAAMLVSYDASDAVFEKMDGTTISIPTSIIGSLKVAEPCIHSKVSNLMDLVHFDERQILHHLRRRFKDGLMYSEINDILISFNPQREIEGLYGEEMIKKYQSMTEDNVDEFEPHIFKFAQESYLKLLCSQESQSLLLSGESGSGQTFNQHHAFKYLLDTIPNDFASEDMIKNIPTAIAVLECFGNAATERNPNSSLFGIWIDLEIETKTQQIVGCNFKEYLLATYRLLEFPMKSNKERSFDALELVRDQIEGSAESRYLPAPNEETASSLSMTLEDLMRKFGELGLSNKDTDQITNILKAIIQIGRIIVDNGHFDQNDAELIVDICKCLGIGEKGKEEFQKIVLKSQMQSTSRHITMRSKQEQSLEMLDQTARFLYRCLFRYLFVNFSFIFKRDPKLRANRIATIGICNFPGFEVDDEGNDLYELMENWAAERLEELYLRDIFNDEVAVFKKEDNVTVRTLMQKAEMEKTMQPTWDLLKVLLRPKTGLLSLIDQHTKLWRSMDSDDDLLLRELSQIQRHNEPYIRIDGDHGFTVSHFGGDTKYDITDFIKKNDNSFPPEMVSVLTQSESNKVLRESVQLFVAMNNEDEKEMNQTASSSRRTSTSNNNNKSSSNDTVIGSFQKELTDLVTRIRKSDPHFIRCFRVHQDPESKNQFDSHLVLQQMQSAGIHHVINIRNLGLPFRFPTRSFVKRYIAIHPDPEVRAKIDAIKGNEEEEDKVDWNVLVESIVNRFWNTLCEPPDERLQSGISTVFMTEAMYSALEGMRDKCLRSTLAVVTRFVKHRHAATLRQEIVLFLKMLKMGIRNQSVDQLIQPLEGIKNLQCDLDLKDALLEHHIVREAEKMANIQMPRYTKQPEQTTISFEMEKESRRQSRILLKHAMETDRRASEDAAAETLSNEMKEEYESKLMDLNMKLKNAKAELAQSQKANAKCLQNECPEEREELRYLREVLSHYTGDFGDLDDIGLSDCPTLDAPTNELLGIEGEEEEEEEKKEDGDDQNGDGQAADGEKGPDGELVDPQPDDQKVEPQPDSEILEPPPEDQEQEIHSESFAESVHEDEATKFVKMTRAIRSKCCDPYFAVRLAQDTLRRRAATRAQYEAEQRGREKERECTVEGMDDINRQLDELVGAINTWKDLGLVASDQRSLAQNMAMVPMEMVLNDAINSLPKLSPETNQTILKSTTYSKTYARTSAIIDEFDNNLKFSLPELDFTAGSELDMEINRIQNVDKIEFGRNPLDDFDAMGGIKEIEFESKEFLKKLHVLNTSKDDSKSDGKRTSIEQLRDLSVETQKLCAELEAEYSPRSSMHKLLQDVDVVNSPLGTGEKVGELEATRLVAVVKAQDSEKEKFVQILRPIKGWIAIQDSSGNPNLDCYCCLR